MLDIGMQQMTEIMQGGGGFGMPFAFSGGMIAITLVVVAALYVYLSLAFMAIGNRTNDPMPGLAWIPFLGPLIIAFRASKMHWWPWLLLIGFIIPVLNMIAMLVFFIYTVVWMWKTFEALNRPGWWSITPVIGFAVQMILMPIGFFISAGVLVTTGMTIAYLIQLVYLVLIGIAAWGKA